MKKIILVRHAKSSWKYNVIDHERPLNKRGLNDAHIISNHLVNSNIDVNLILSSDSVRTKTTANIFVNNLNIHESLVELNHSLYDFSGQNFLEVIKMCSNDINNLMVFGHNHAITDFVNTYGNIYIDNVPTCGVVIIDLDIKNWNELKKGKTIKTLFPRDLKK